MSGVFYNEIDKYCCDWLSNLMDAGLITPGVICDRSIEDVFPDELAGYRRVHLFAGIGLWDYALNIAGWGDDEVWTLSCPCQPFSAAGKGAGFADERHLWPSAYWLIKQRKPRRMYGEQVTSPAARAWLDLVCTDLESIGYSCGASVLPVASVGAPQERDRFWWVADSDYARRQGRIRERESDASREERPAARGEPLRSMRGPWPPGPAQVNDIPILVDGNSGRVGRLRAIGNAISPEVAAEFIRASREAIDLTA
jgi:DNA (cytosine-5)-methyltransferase 1